MSTIKERYAPKVVAANSTVTIDNSNVGGFICTTGGTITLTRESPSDTLINAMAVTAGTYYPLPIYLGHNGGSFTTAGGAVGLLLV